MEILQIKLSDSTFTPASGYIGFGFLFRPRGIEAGGGGALVEGVKHVEVFDCNFVFKLIFYVFFVTLCV